MALSAMRVVRSDFPPNMAASIVRAMIMLEIVGSRSLRKPIYMLGYQVSCFHIDVLRYLFYELFVEGSYCFRADNSAPVIFDCGSNIGMSILFFKRLYPNAHITGFEPDPQTFQMLQRNVERNSLQDVVLQQCALAELDGEIKFYHNSQEPGALRMSILKERAGEESIVVRARRLSDYICSEIDLLKIDIEGAEEGVLVDLATTGKLSLVKQIHLEYHHHIIEHADRLSRMLHILETQGFGYQLRAKSGMWPTPGQFQDIGIFAYRKSKVAASAADSLTTGYRRKETFFSARRS